MEPLRRFLREHFRLGKDVHLADDLELLPNIVDSFGVIELADFLEEAFEIRFDREDLLAFAENFRSIRSIEALIERKRGRASTDVG
jgi:acyl carrier protein